VQLGQPSNFWPIFPFNPRASPFLPMLHTRALPPTLLAHWPASDFHARIKHGHWFVGPRCQLQPHAEVVACLYVDSAPPSLVTFGPCAPAISLKHHHGRRGSQPTPWWHNSIGNAHPRSSLTAMKCGRARAWDSVEIHNHPRIPRSARPSFPRRSRVARGIKRSPGFAVDKRCGGEGTTAVTIGSNTYGRLEREDGSWGFVGCSGSCSLRR
jgi:hypothetical protein